MPRGRKFIKQIEVEEHTLQSASHEFYKHNRIKGLATETQKPVHELVQGSLHAPIGRI